MKKKSLKNLLLHKYSVSNLALLHREIGGASGINTDAQGSANPNDATFDAVCILVNMSIPSDCPTCYNNVCGTVRAQPPTEYQGCNGINTNTYNAPQHASG